MEENKKQPQSTSEQQTESSDPKRRAVAAIGSLICTTR